MHKNTKEIYGIKKVTMNTRKYEKVHKTEIIMYNTNRYTSR